jgi:AcrR family transcriptional regulator
VEANVSNPSIIEPEMGAQPRTKRAVEKRRKVMQAAAKLIADKGYHDTSMRDIAAAMNMSAASLYHYFPGKEDLVIALQTECFEELMRRAHENIARFSSPVDRLYGFVHNHMTYFVEHIALIRVLLHEDGCLSSANREIIKRYKQEYVGLCDEIVRALPRDGGAPAVDPRVVVFSLFGMMNWFYTWQHSAPDLSGHELAEGMTQLFLRGYQSSEAAVPALVL